MRENEYDLSKFHELMDGKGHVMIWAPRRSGKTYALIHKFVRTRGSVIISPNIPMMREVDNNLVRMGEERRRLDSYNLSYNSGSMLRGRRFEYIFIDEIDHYRGDIGELWANLVPSGGKIVAVSTPTNVRHAHEYVSVFDSIFTWNPLIDQVDVHKSPIVSYKLRVNDHFDKEKELFKI